MFRKMAFNRKYIILICCLMLGKFVHGTENNFLGRISLDADEVTSMTNTLDNAKMKRAFSNLRLSDPKVPTGFADESKFVNYIDEGGRDSGIDKNDQYYYNLENDGGEDLYLDNNAMEKAARFTRSNAEYFNENTRAKREDSQTNRNSINEEYLKLLEGSFPQVSNQNEDIPDDVSEDKQDHVRVKRVPPYY